VRSSREGGTAETDVFAGFGVGGWVLARLTIALSFEQTPGGDQVVEYDGFRVVVSDQCALSRRREIDSVRSLTAGGSSSRNPGARQTCGCALVFRGVKASGRAPDTSPPASSSMATLSTPVPTLAADVNYVPALVWTARAPPPTVMSTSATGASRPHRASPRPGARDRVPLAWPPSWTHGHISWTDATISGWSKP